MADEFFDLFNQLFYSSDVWGFLGLVFVLAFCLLVVKKVGLAFIMCVPILGFMGIEYLSQAQTTPHLAWQAIFCLMGALVVGLVGFLEVKSD